MNLRNREKQKEFLPSQTIHPSIHLSSVNGVPEMDVQGTAGWRTLPYKSGHSGTGIKE